MEFNDMLYDVEANIISIELAKDQIVDTKEFGNILLHLSSIGKPVLIEILDASKLVGKFEKLSPKQVLEEVSRRASIA